MEECAGEGLDRAGKSGGVGEGRMEAEDSDVLLSCCASKDDILADIARDYTHLHPVET